MDVFQPSKSSGSARSWRDPACPHCSHSLPTWARGSGGGSALLQVCLGMGMGMGLGLEPKPCWHHDEPLQHMEPFPWESLPMPLGGLSLLTAACPFPDLSCPSHRAPWRLIPTGKAQSDSRYSHMSFASGRETCVHPGPFPDPSHRVHPSHPQNNSSSIFCPQGEGEGAEVPPNRNGWRGAL